MFKDERKARTRAFGFCGVRGRSLGFSLIELIIAVAIVGILFTAVAPAFSNMMSRSQLAVATNAARGALMVAREGAVTRGHPVSLCSGEPANGCSGDWSRGQWIVFRDSNHSGDLDSGETVLQHGRVPGVGQSVAMSGNGPLRSALVYMPLGHAERISGAFGAGRLRVCVKREIVPNARELIVSASGRVRMQSVDFNSVCPSL